MFRLSLLAVLLAVASTASAEDLEESAERRMKLSFDYDELDARLDAPAPSPAAEMTRGYGEIGVRTAALPLEPNSKVDTVTVFRDRALVTRVRSVKVGAGTTSVEFQGLPLGLQSNSLHGQLRAGKARIVGVELLSGQGEVEETERIKTLRAEMRGLVDELGEVRDRIEALLAQRSYLRQTLLGKPADGSARPAVSEVKGMFAYVGEAEREIAGKLRVEEDKARELDRKLHPLLVKLDDPLATGMTVRVDVEVDAAGEVEVGLRYQVDGARWFPSYNARFDASTSQVDFEYYGVVTQNTGEVWDSATLLLSTANPAVSGTVPRLTSWYLGRGGGVVDNLLGGRGLYADPDNRQAAVGTQTSSIVGTEMTADVQGQGAVVFGIQGPRTIPGDGSEQRLPVGVQTFRVTTELAAVPKAVSEVFRRARIRYDGALPLLPGAVATYVGSDYVGSGSLGNVVPGEEFTLAFGTEDKVKVERQLVARNLETVGKRSRYTFHFRMRVSNFGDVAQQVQLVDQLPVAEVERVVVKLIQSSDPLPTDPKDGPGILKWNLDVPAGGEQVVELEFSVLAPDDISLPELEMMML